MSEYFRSYLIFFRFAQHLMFMFLVYDVIHKCYAALGYSLLVKSQIWAKTKSPTAVLIYDCLTAAAVEIKTTNKCTNKTILTLERQVQTVVTSAPNLFARCYQFCLHFKAFIVTDGMLALWITINPANLRFFLIVQLAGLQNNNIGQSAISEFTRKTAIMNPVVVARFFHKTCNAIFNHLLAANIKEDGLFGPILTYFDAVKTNGWGILHLHYLIWLTEASHFAILQSNLHTDLHYNA